MTRNYLKNLLNNSVQGSNIVQPRLKSRFEDSSVPFQNEELENYGEKKSPSLERKSPTEKSVFIEDKMFETVIHPSHNPKEKIIPEENQPQFLNTSKKHLYSSDKEEERKREYNGTTLPRPVIIEKPLNKIPVRTLKETPKNSYGILNKPPETIVGKEKSNNRNLLQIPGPGTPAAAGPPSIKISIGRIEVRAVNTSPKKTAKPINKPELKMSLADYIERRK